jgi:2-iminobutanoate/2-iminopropanoate deaminase
MAKKIMVSPGLPATISPYSQVVEGKGDRLIFISGQVSHDAEGNLVGPGDMETQIRQVFANLEIAIKSAGGQMSDITKLGILLTQLNPEVFAVLAQVRKELFPDGDYPASTLMQVSGLASPDWLVEIEAYAVV